jgi:4-hydroxy-3-polyprenylbenzoate decarboxylase
MAYPDLQKFVETLERSGELIRIKKFVNPCLEISEVVDRLSKHDGKAVLFENTGTDFPVLMNAMGSEKRMCLALGFNSLDEPGMEMERLLKEVSAPHPGILNKLSMLGTLRQFAAWMPKTRKGKGDCQKVVMEKPMLSKLPVIKCWPQDGGPFITLPMVHTVDPVTGAKNMGMYRMQVFSDEMTGMHWHLHKNSAKHFRAYKELHQRMPVTVTLGGDPVYTYAATAPLPENIDEYLLAGFLRKKKVKLVKCLTNDLYVPSDVDFVIEGYVDPDEELMMEGPFGDHTGFYSLADLYPKFHVTCITHRKDAIYPATIVGIPPQEDLWMGKATERIFLAPIRMMMVPEIVDMWMPAEGVFHNIVIAKIKKEYEGQVFKVMNSLWGAGQMMFNKVMIVVDGDTKVNDAHSVLKAITDFVDPARDLYFSKGPADVLDHSSERFAFGSKLGIDATHKEAVNGKIAAIDEAVLCKSIIGIKRMNTGLAEMNIPVLIVAVDKIDAGGLPLINYDLVDVPAIDGIKFIIYTDNEVDIYDLSTVAWVVANHIDPERDCYVEKTISGTPCLGIDGTRKTKDFDGFERDWPNPVVMDDKTIASVDKMWNELGLGTFLPSPSLKYRGLMRGEGAVAEGDG